MRITPLLLVLSLFSTSLLGCPPVRNDDDDSVGDDDDATDEPLVLEEGFWMSSALNVVSDVCGLGDQAEVLSFELSLVDAWSFEVDFGVGPLATCDISGGEGFLCGESEFVIDDDPEATVVGRISFDGDILSPTRIDGVVDWAVTCTGDCSDMGLPENTTCPITFEASFMRSNETEPDEPVDG
jgi:hypothetical protein